MMVIIGIDGLEYDYVKEFDFPNLMQKTHGTTNLSEFEEPRTMVIWSSFLSGKNQEKRILAEKEIWKFRLRPEETFFSKFKKHIAIDVPGYTQDMEQHNKERQAMKDFFADKIKIEDYDKIVFEHHNKIKQKFFESLEQDYDVVMGYFNAADVIGHLSFGLKPKMKIIYKEMDDIVKKTYEKADELLVISDHSDHGFWSFNREIKLEKPEPMEFYDILTG
jgi:hypothetical protein